MSKYTIELREVVSVYGEDEVRNWFSDYNMEDFLRPEQIQTVESAGLWTKEKLADRLIRHFFTREIGFETPALFKLRLKDEMELIMEEYLPLIYSTSIEYDPLVNVDYTESYVGKDVSKADGLSINSDTPQGQISKSEILEGKYASSTGASEDTNTTNQQYEKRIRGNSGVSATAQAMVMQYRGTIRNITAEIEKRLEPLFIGLY